MSLVESPGLPEKLGLRGGAGCRRFTGEGSQDQHPRWGSSSARSQASHTVVYLGKET